jgi:hypothetical protein
MKARRGRKRKQLLDDLKERRGYWKLKAEALDGTLNRTCFGRGFSNYGSCVGFSGVQAIELELILDTCSVVERQRVTRAFLG